MKTETIDLKYGIDRNHIVLQDSPAVIVASCNLLRSNWNETAELIVKAVNNYDALVRSLAKLVNWHKAHDEISFIETDDLKEAEQLLNQLNESK